MKNSRFERLLHNIYSTQEEEISCTECFDLISGYVDLEFTDGNPAAVMPQVHQHLGQCRACREEYEALHDLRQLDEADHLPSVDNLKDSIR
jgi:predicted anti-sigma-YlaC factor YlaD